MGDDFFEYFKEFTDKMHDTFSESAYKDFIDVFTDCAVENNEHYILKVWNLLLTSWTRNTYQLSNHRRTYRNEKSRKKVIWKRILLIKPV